MGRNSVTNLQKMAGNNPCKVDLVSMNANTKFNEIVSIGSQDIVRKQNYDGMTELWKDGQPKSSIAPTFSKQGYKSAILSKAAYSMFI